jgi:hypothetical protein
MSIADLIFIELDLEMLLLCGGNDESIVSKRNALRKELGCYRSFDFVDFHIIDDAAQKNYRGIFIQEENLIYYKNKFNGGITLKVDVECCIGKVKY